MYNNREIKEVNISCGNQLLDSIVDSHNDSVIVCKRGEFIIKSLNVAATQLLSVSKSTAIGKRLRDLLPVVISDDLYNQINNFPDNNSKIIDTILPSKFGFTYNVKVSTMQNNVLFLIKNISLNNDSIEGNNFKMLFENMSSGFIFLKAINNDDGSVVNHQILDVNSTFEILFGQEREQVIGKFITDVLPGFDNIWVKILGKSAKCGGSYSADYHFQNKKHFEVRTYSPRKGYSAAVFNDIKQEMEIRNDLMIKNEISKAFAMGHDSSVYKVVLNLVLKNTESTQGFIGYMDSNDTVATLARCNDVLPIKTNQHGVEFFEIANVDYVNDCLKSKNMIFKEINGIRTMIVPVINDKNDIIGFICFSGNPKPYTNKMKNFVKSIADYISPLMVVEIKERVYRRQLVEAKERAEANERLKTAFLANISHEIRTPMNGICGFSDLLAKSTNLTDKQRKYLDFIIKSTRQLLHIVEDIMDMSKLQTQQIKLNLSAVNVNAMLMEVLQELEPSAFDKHIFIDLVKSLPDSEAVVSTDYYKLKKIISCLVSNGVKFTNTGGVTFGYTVDDKYITYFVKDTGIGIRKELHKGIFTSFQQVENAMERKYNGAGVGLSISKGFVDLLGGEITLDSEPNKGSTFYVKFTR